jgi:hypothetical protein
MIQHLILLVIQLLAVLHILPFTTTTNTKMANWFNSMFRKFMKVNCFSFVVRLTFLERLHINHIAGTTFGIITLPSGAFATDTPLHQHGLLFDERQLCLYFLSHAQNKRLNGFINSNWDFF